MRRRTNNKFNILACDPSMTGWGYSVLDQNGNIIDCGCVKTGPSPKKLNINKGNDRVRRVSELNYILKSQIVNNNVKYIVSEISHGSQSAQAALSVGGVMHQMQTIADMFDLGIEWYSEGDCKKHLLGKQSATKKEIIKSIDKLYQVPWPKFEYQQEAVADSLAVHYIAISKSSALKLMKIK